MHVYIYIRILACYALARQRLELPAGEESGEVTVIRRCGKIARIRNVIHFLKDAFSCGTYLFRALIYYCALYSKDYEFAAQLLFVIYI